VAYWHVLYRRTNVSWYEVTSAQYHINWVLLLSSGRTDLNL
jgi:hypothetical protein